MLKKDVNLLIESGQASAGAALHPMHACTQLLEMLVLVQNTEKQKQLSQNQNIDSAVLVNVMTGLLSSAAMASKDAEDSPECSAFQQELLACAVHLLPVVRLVLLHAAAPATKTEREPLEKLVHQTHTEWITMINHQREAISGVGGQRGIGASVGVKGCGSLIALQLNSLESGLRSCRDPFQQKKQGRTLCKLVYGLAMSLVTQSLDKHLAQGIWELMGHALGKLTRDQADKIYAPLGALQLAGVLVRVRLSRDKPQPAGSDALCLPDTADAHVVTFLACLRNKIFDLDKRRTLFTSKASLWEPRAAYIHVVAELLVSPDIHTRTGLVRSLLFHSASPRRPALLVAPAANQPGCEATSLIGLMSHELDVGQPNRSRAAITLQFFDWARKIADVTDQEPMRKWLVDGLDLMHALELKRLLTDCCNLRSSLHELLRSAAPPELDEQGNLNGGEFFVWVERCVGAIKAHAAELQQHAVLCRCT